MPDEDAPVCYRHPKREAHIRCQRCGRRICPDCMRQASVGFQCPSCVSEGVRSTRSGRTAYGGRRSSNPARTSQVLIAINAAVWLLVLATGAETSPWLYRLALLPSGVCFHPASGQAFTIAEPACVGQGLQWIPGVADGAYWQLVTSMFVHVSVLHIGFNMLALWFLGPQLEAAVGRARFLVLYFLSGLTGAAAVYWLAPVHAPTIGASGAIFGLLGALLVIAIKVRADISQLLLWIGLNFVITVIGRGFISWQGHLGGFIGGALIGLLYAYAPREHRSLWQGLGVGALSALVAFALALRTFALA